jgi:hypothetical protein
MKPDPTRNTRAAKYRAAAKTAGGVRVDVHIGPEAAAVLARMRETMTVREAVELAFTALALMRPPKTANQSPLALSSRSVSTRPR